MKNTIYNLLLILIIPLIFFNTAHAESEQEYKVKAAFIYNFVKFIEWPTEKISDEKIINIGIIGINPFGKAIESLEDKQIGNKKIELTLFDSLEKSELTDKNIEDIRKCHVLFICNSEKKKFKEIINLIKGYSVLSVGDTKGFLELGGIINFIIENQKVGFEINNYRAKDSKLNIRSQLLRLAKKVIEQNSKDEKMS